MMTKAQERAGVAFLIVCGTALVFLFVAFFAYMESATYNRLTGSETTWWDALWVELRVQDSPKTEADDER